MQGEELVNLCQAVMHGNRRCVRNVNQGRSGRVVNCHDDGSLEVESDGGREVWAGADCRAELNA